MSIGGGKIVIAGPHREIGENELTDHHDVIFAIVLGPRFQRDTILHHNLLID